jgi:NAD-specific glutamate dehydrogenase
MQKMQDLIAQVIDFSQKKKQFVGFDGKDFTTFVKNFFSVSTSHDFLNYSIEELYNAALLSFDFYVNKKPGEFKVRICNPTIEKNGFETSSSRPKLGHFKIPVHLI